MRPSEFEAIRPHLEEALDHIDRYLNRQREIEEEAPKLWEAALAGKLPKAKLRTLTEEEQQEAVRIFRSQPPALIEHAYPWGHSAARAAVDLRDCGWTKEAEAIGEVLSGLPTGLVDGNQPENMARRFDAIRAGADRLKTILTTCLAGPKDKGSDDPADNGGKGDDPGRLTPEARAILFVQEQIKTTGKLPTKTAIATALDVDRRTLNNWSAFKVAYKKLQSENRRQPAKGTKAKDGTLEAWRESGK